MSATASDSVRKVSMPQAEYCGPAGLLHSGSVDVYGIHLDSYLDCVESFDAVLSAAECSEIARLKAPLHRRRVTISRGCLRMLVGGCLQTLPSDVPLYRDYRGQPQLDVDRLPGRDRPRVSCSRSGPFAIFAVAAGQSIGIDIEAVTSERFSDRVAPFFLSSLERIVYADIPIHARTLWLARTWVCKEAILKGLGCGLEIDPASMTIGVRQWDLTSHVPAWAPQRTASFSSWRLSETMWNRNVIAVATQGVAPSLRFTEVRFPFLQRARSRA